MGDQRVKGGFGVLRFELRLFRGQIGGFFLLFQLLVKRLDKSGVLIGLVGGNWFFGFLFERFGIFKNIGFDLLYFALQL